MEPQEILAQIAAGMGLSPEELREQLQILIHSGAADENPDKARQWKESGKEITPEQYICRLVDYVRTQVEGE